MREWMRMRIPPSKVPFVTHTTLILRMSERRRDVPNDKNATAPR